MRFRKNVRLDPSQVEDRRGRGGIALPGGGLAVGGGGLGVAGLVIYLLVTLLTNGGGLSPPLENLNERSVATQSPSSELGSACRSGAAANTREDCRIVGYVNSIQGLLGRPVPPGRPRLHDRAHGLLRRLDRHRLRHRDL